MEKDMQKIKIGKYDDYVDSGVEWLGEIPSCWESLSNKYIFKLKKNLVGKNSGKFTLLSLTLGGIIKRDVENGGGKFPAEFDTYQEVRKGDFVFCLFDVEETPRTVGLSKFDGMITGAYTVFEVNSHFDSAFLFYFYLNLDTNKRMKPLYTGLRNTIAKDRFFTLKTFVPSLLEQTAIAKFLDDKCEKIDKAIVQKQKLIALLKERKQILIQNAVTKGIDPNVELVDSGIDWIGKIPSHWEVKPVKYLGRMINGFAFNSSDFKISGVRVMKISNIQTMNIDWTDASFIDSKYYESLPSFRIHKGDLVFALTRPIISTGIKASIVDCKEKILLNQRNAVLKPFENLYKRWIYYIILDVRFAQEFEKKIDKTGQQPNISTSSIGNIRIPFPSFTEQKLISLYIQEQVAKIEKAISLQERQIEKLKEYKANLINSAVTGKIKVY